MLLLHFQEYIYLLEPTLLLCFSELSEFVFKPEKSPNLTSMVSTNFHSNLKVRSGESDIPFELTPFKWGTTKRKRKFKLTKPIAVSVFSFRTRFKGNLSTFGFFSIH